MENIFECNNHFQKYQHVKSHLLYGDLNKIPSPRITIMMPVFNHPRYFKKALNSAINQDFEESYEIIIVDNNDLSDVPTEYQKIVEELGSSKVLYYRNEKNIGMFGNWNRCIELARGALVTYLHDDDMFFQNTLTFLMDLHKKYPNKAIFPAHNEIDENDNVIRYVQSTKEKGFIKYKQIYNYSLFDQFIGSVGFGVGFLFDRNNMLSIGGYDESCAPSADYALQMVYTWKFGAIYSEIPSFNYRIAENESFSGYTKFANVDMQFRNYCKDKIAMPNFILNRIIKANYNLSSYYSKIRWGKQCNIPKPIFSDRIIMYIIYVMRKLKHLDLF